MPPDKLRSKPIRLNHRFGSLLQLSSLQTGPRHVHQKARLPFVRQAACVYAFGDLQRFAGIAELDTDGDPVQLNIGRTELGMKVVATLADELSKRIGRV